MVIYSEFSHETWWIFPVRYVNVYQVVIIPITMIIYAITMENHHVDGIIIMKHHDNHPNYHPILSMIPSCPYCSAPLCSP